MPAWVAYMKAALSDVPERQLALPPNIMEKTIDSNSGLLSEGGGRKEYFIVGTEPKRTYIAEMQERGYYVPPELQQRLNGGTGKPKMRFLQRNQKNYSNPDLNTKSVVNFNCTFTSKGQIMLSYRHSFHAGNHADVLKHIVLMLEVGKSFR